MLLLVLRTSCLTCLPSPLRSPRASRASTGLPSRSLMKLLQKLPAVRKVPKGFPSAFGIVVSFLLDKVFLTDLV